VELSDKRVLITGAARGIGAETARVLAQRGARLSLVGLEPQGLQALAAELGPEHAWFEADVTDQAALEAAAAGTFEKLGGIDVVIANAGIAPFGTLAQGDPDVFARGVEINLTGVIRTVRATASDVAAADGYFLLLSSVSAFSGIPGVGVYVATKAGIESLANSLRMELSGAGVAVGVAHPGWIDTDLVRDGDDDFDSFRLFRARLPWPLKKTTSLEHCAEALADAIERRKRRIFIPRSMALISRLRNPMNSRLGQRVIRRRARSMLDGLDREVAEKGALAGRTRELERYSNQATAAMITNSETSETPS
jgi:NAD(P)-dependent dehydrogenase (short-subunit alcohol dehydrogenase family)